MENISLSKDLDTDDFNQSSDHNETLHIFENFSIRNNSVQFIQPNAAMIAFREGKAERINR